VTPELRAAIAERSGGRCEAEVLVSLAWVRCQNQATDIHHLLTAARGGRNLDRVEETYHLIHLCRECHGASDGASAYQGGMLIDGRVTWDKLRNKPQYQGTDPYLTKRYPTHTDG
jgi:hypothetical protein